MKNIKIHISIWIAYFIIVYISDVILNPEITLSAEIVIFLTHNIFLFYSLLFVINKFSIKSRKLAFLGILRCLIVVTIFFGLKTVNVYCIFPLIYGPIPDSPKIKWITTGFLWIINYSLFALAYFYFQPSIQKQKDLLKSREEKLTKEKENIQLENTALRAQINPHFLYNTLDFLYAKALPVSDELSDGVMKLSDIMRYSLKPQDAEGLVYLADEAEHIQNIIEMNQLRFDNKLNVDFTIGNIPGDVKIMPLLLITMVENVFKHGATNSPEFPARIILGVDGQERLHFSTHNKKRAGPKEHSTGIGLNNTLKRLKNTYGERCNVSVTDKLDEFKVEINIQLLRNENNYLV